MSDTERRTVAFRGSLRALLGRLGTGLVAGIVVASSAGCDREEPAKMTTESGGLASSVNASASVPSAAGRGPTADVSPQVDRERAHRDACDRVLAIVRSGNRALAESEKNAARDPVGALDDIHRTLRQQAVTLRREPIDDPDLARDVGAFAKLLEGSASASERAAEAAATADMEAMASAERDMGRLSRQGDDALEKITSSCGVGASSP